MRRAWHLASRTRRGPVWKDMEERWVRRQVDTGGRPSCREERQTFPEEGQVTAGHGQGEAPQRTERGRRNRSGCARREGQREP